ncbi:MAG TPA: cation diffusion facilitator family transporter [Gaiellaceae bacterium]
MHGTHDHQHLKRGAERQQEDRRSLQIALALLVAVMGIEITFGIVASSLALLADAGHMLTDALALVLAILAVGIAARPAGGRFTYGLGRVEVLSAQANGISLLLIGGWITYSAVRRLIDPPEVRGGIVLVVALIGALANIAAAAVLARGQSESINVRGAFLHITTDLAGFLGTALAGGLILLTGWNRFDPIASLGVALLCFISAFSLTRESLRIVLEGSPDDIDPAAIGQMLALDSEVAEVHDLHVWTVTSGFPALSAHVLVRQDSDCHAARARLAEALSDQFGIDHTTLQVDHISSAGHSLKLGAASPRKRPLDHS